ncbi:STT3 domain-containing protein [Halorussus ruber]|uniref:STT3 domain-containing protein n=1 Tax=Halorussus ruber TaxID=1126238 RepID=UPI001092E572|nr:STT3 domain-containing protein [Halorussus ruber]
MTDIRESTDDLLTEKPDIKSDLRDVVAVDKRTDDWSFDDIPLDSGTFGELVSRNIVVKEGNRYKISDRKAVEASLEGETNPSDASSSERLSFSFPSISRIEAGGLGAALAFVVLMRTYIFPSVFRGEFVVLPSNDPYYYRYWVERLSANATGVFDFSVLSGLPDAVAKGEPLMIATLWWFANLFGGTDAAGWVLAWYPVVSALIVGVLTYAMAVRITDDRRVGLASVVLLAVIPAFAYRTGLGFADHHAFDYPWLALTALSLAALADVNRERLLEVRTWVTASVLGVAVAGQVLAWEAGPLLIGALGVYVAVRTITDVRAGRSPVVTNTPILVGLAVATGLSYSAHVSFGWHTYLVAYSPALLFVSVAGISLIGEAVRQAEMPAFVLATAEVAGGLSGLALLNMFLPRYAWRLRYETTELLFNSGPAETQSIFAGGLVGVFLGPILEMGFTWVLAVPMLGIAGWRAYRRNHSTWLVVCVYGSYFLLLATLQRRFVGELAPFVAVLAAYALVVLLAKLDVTASPSLRRDKNEPVWRGRMEQSDENIEHRLFELPDRSTISAVAVLLLFITSAGAVQTAVRHEQVKIADDKFQASVWMDGYAEEQGLEYPENYVLSKWGRNRMYNYFVNEQSESFTFARETYEQFLSSRTPKSEYRKLKDEVGFVVTKNLDLRHKVPPKSNYARLHHRYGSAGKNGADGAGHYRAVYASKDGSVKVFALVPGANVSGTSTANGTVIVSKQVKIEGSTFEYRRVVDIGKDGEFSVTVPYSGQYRVGNRTVEVSESAVENGGNVTVNS